ncbi:hypothetical protein FDECE_8999 [Fusarium decemcellulare]|nr:hypothetical protein FDECE_8999 [Fusarium decemcellulare]
MSDTRDKNSEAAAESTADYSSVLKGGTPEEKVNAWLELTRDEAGHFKAGDWMQTLVPHLFLVSLNPKGPHPSCTFSYTVQPDNCNRLQNLHGGCTATLFDWCTTLPLAMVNRPGFWQGLGVSRTLNVTYMRPVPVGEEVLLECEIVQRISLQPQMGDAINDKAREPTLTALPAEILHHILRWLAPADLFSLPRVSSALNAFTKGNRKLYRDVYLNTLDTPKDTDLDWEKEVRELVRLEAICRRRDAFDKKPELDFVHSVVTRLLRNASSAGEHFNLSRTHAASRNAAFLSRLFANETTSEAFLQRSSLFERLRSDLRHSSHTGVLGPSSTEAGRKALQQQSAHLHCLYGSAIQNVGRLRSMRTYPFACSKVYDLREYTQRTKWGPFLNDGSTRVDWEKVEAILVVLGNNIGERNLISRIFGEIWKTPFCGSWPDSFMAPPPRDITSLDARDPYGVAGTWHQIVCFLDYSDFFEYNFPEHEFVGAHAPRPPLDVGEATRLIMLRLEVTSIEPPGPDDGQDLPVVHFKGVSRSLDDSFDDNANSDIRGTARLTREGEVRWTTFSIFHGVERWRSEGIQIGGVRSARGVVGNWFDRDYDVHGPAGPTAFWKSTWLKEAAKIEDDLLPNDFFIPYAGLIDLDFETDPEAETPYSAEDENDEDDEEDEDMGVAAEELPALLQDAGLPLEDVGVDHLAVGHPRP